MYTLNKHGIMLKHSDTKTNISYQLSSFDDFAFDVCPRSVEGTSCNGGFSFFKIASTFTSSPCLLLSRVTNAFTRSSVGGHMSNLNTYSCMK